MTNLLYHGTEADAQGYIRPFVALGPVKSKIGPMRWTEVTKSVTFASDAETCTRGRYHSVYSANIKRFDAQTFKSSLDRMVKFYEKYPEGRQSAMVFEMFPNNAALKTPDSATAYPWRDAKGNL